MKPYYLGMISLRHGDYLVSGPKYLVGHHFFHSLKNSGFPEFQKVFEFFNMGYLKDECYIQPLF